ncbi:hypothetical protein AXF42_Ash018796 [Apostasia shenzhenica]|uniref:Late embryogenesis abundant protein LEA-2 subgroup domain-containing protein n=1 Tax=Apostasia shenzhenica TaxID=1088818 RepID=A0A2I0B154_9ASPA|nr:hypothetical protein AXF42_Ash018796 [Apostasia shenzhenica]
MMAHAKTDSEVTSNAPSSPTRSPRRPVYYVQSPSRDSHDGEKTTASFHSTPVLSPTASPPHSHSSVGHHSRESSSSRFSGSLKPGVSRKVNPDGAGVGSRRGGRHKGSKPWKEHAVIEEEGLLEEDDEHPRGLIPRRCYFPVFVLAFSALFSFFALILWGASRSQRPEVSMKSITFENFAISAGTDASLVPTDLATLNSTVRMTFWNTGTFFGVHVTSTPVDLSYYELTLASGGIKEFYQSRKGRRNLSIVVSGNKVPLYGGAASLSAPATSRSSGGGGGAAIQPPVPLKLRFTVRSRAYVLGRLVNPKFYTRIECDVDMDQSKLNKPVSLMNACQIN